jgi:hypothetical protein
MDKCQHNKGKIPQRRQPNNALLEAQLTRHSSINNINLDTVTWSFEIINILLYLDDGSFIFMSREDMIRGLNLIWDTAFKVIGLEMHIREHENKSKTKLMYFPLLHPFSAIQATYYQNKNNTLPLPPTLPMTL